MSAPCTFPGCRADHNKVMPDMDHELAVLLGELIGRPDRMDSSMTRELMDDIDRAIDDATQNLIFHD